MALSSLSKPVGQRVMGIDASTHTIAYCIFDGEKPVEYGELNFDGGTLYERIVNAKRIVKALRNRFNVDFVAIEAAVMVRSAQTGLKMAYTFGAIMGELLENGATVIEVHPIQWQSFIGNKNYTKAEKEKVKRDNPGRSDSWIKNEIRLQRKQKTISFMDKLGVHTTSDNVADAAGIAWFAVNELHR